MLIHFVTAACLPTTMKYCVNATIWNDVLFAHYRKVPELLNRFPFDILVCANRPGTYTFGCKERFGTTWNVNKRRESLPWPTICILDTSSLSPSHWLLGGWIDERRQGIYFPTYSTYSRLFPWNPPFVKEESLVKVGKVPSTRRSFCVALHLIQKGLACEKLSRLLSNSISSSSSSSPSRLPPKRENDIVGGQKEMEKSISRDKPGSQ